MRDLQRALEGEIGVAGPELAAGLAQLGLIDEYRFYLRPVVLGGGTPFFAEARPPLRFLSSEIIGHDAIRLAYAPLDAHATGPGQGGSLA